jgi:hypothetical protein
VEGNKRSSIDARLLESGLSHAMGFLEVMLSVHLLGTFARRYIPKTQEIKAVDGTIVAKISPVAISQTLKILERALAKDVSFMVACEFFKANEDWWNSSMVKGWLKSEKRGNSKLPTKFKRTHFKEEIVDAITLLHRLVGNAQIENFKDWMYQFILVICDENVFVDWARIIFFHLNEQLVNFQKMATFHLCSFFPCS